MGPTPASPQQPNPVPRVGPGAPSPQVRPLTVGRPDSPQLPGSVSKKIGAKIEVDAPMKRVEIGINREVKKEEPAGGEKKKKNIFSLFSKKKGEGKADLVLPGAGVKRKRGFLSKLSQPIGKISAQERIDFARNLSIVIKAGLPLVTGLSVIRKQIPSKRLGSIIDRVLEDVNNGRFLADSLERYKNTFGEFFVNIVRVGEASGTLGQNLLYLSDELKKSRELRSKVRSAMIYPGIILVATTGITAFLAFFVLPKILPVLYGLNVELPATTKALIATVDYLRNYGAYTLAGLIGGYIGLRVAMNHVKLVRYFFHKMILATPVLGKVAIAINMVTFTRVFGILLKSGVKIVEALHIAKATMTNRVFQRLIGEAAEDVQKGGQLASALGLHKHFFPPLLVGMIEVGENTGNLEDNLFYISEYYSEEVDTKLKNLTSFLEPMLLLFMGLVVGFVALSIITPIYSLSQGLS